MALCNSGQFFPFFTHRLDYLEIVNDGILVGKYCDWWNRENILLTGDQILIKFHSDHVHERRGLLIYFNAVPHGKYIF